MIAVHVADLLRAGDNLRLIEDVKNLFKQMNKWQDMGHIEFVLGTEVYQNLENKTMLKICVSNLTCGQLNPIRYPQNVNYLREDIL